jgi:hypothetical protein
MSSIKPVIGVIVNFIIFSGTEDAQKLGLTESSMMDEVGVQGKPINV